MRTLFVPARRNCGEKSSAKLGRCSIPACFLATHAGDSGKNGRMMMSGIAGITPEDAVAAIVAAEIRERDENFLRVGDDAGFESLFRGPRRGRQLLEEIIVAAQQLASGFTC